MSILVNKKSKVIVQGFTGTEGTFHKSNDWVWNKCSWSVTPEGGQTHLDKPVFNTVLML